MATSYHNFLRKYKIRSKRWYLGRQFRHMAKISRHFEIDMKKKPTLIWKGSPLCSLIPFNDFQNAFIDKTAFIIASGPSIKEIDIKPLQDHYTFGVNGSLLKFLQCGISPSFYVISDEDFIYNRFEIVSDILRQENCHCFFTPQALSAICEINANLLKGQHKITLFDNHFKKFGQAALEFEEIVDLAKQDPSIITKNGRIGFSLNPDIGLFTAHTVPYFALQIAYGLGFRTINLMGMDLGSPTGETRFYERGKRAMPSHLDRDYENTILPSFTLLSELCKTKTLRVYNLSPISRLPEQLIERKTFAEALHDCRPNLTTI